MKRSTTPEGREKPLLLFDPSTRSSDASLYTTGSKWRRIKVAYEEEYYASEESTSLAKQPAE